MRFYTHLIFSVLVGKWYAQIGTADGIFWAALLFFTLLPDIDEQHSFIGKRLPFISKPLQSIFGHRGLFHSLLLILPIFLLLLNFPEVALGFLIGMCSHLLLDSLTPQGILPLYPMKLRIHGFVKTGGIMEHLLLVCFLVLLFI